MKINILDETIVFEDKNLYPAFPSIIKLDDKRLLVSFRTAPRIKKNYSHLHSLSKSMLAVINKNKTDKIFEFAEDDSAAKQDAQLFRVDEKTIIAYYFRYTFHPMNEKDLFNDYTFIEYDNTIALLDGIGICVSYDNGDSFSKPYVIKVYDDNNIIMKNFAVRGSMCKIGNEILVSVYAYKKNINKKDCKYQCYVISSRDLINWKLKSLLCETEFKKIDGEKSRIEYVEPSLLSYKNNLAAFIRTHINNEYGLTSISYSKDKGKTFSKPVFTDIKGYPLNPLILENGKVILTYGYRLKPYGVRAIVFDNINEIFDIEKINYKANNEEIILDSYMKSTDCGYPWCVENNGIISSVYYGYKDKNKTRKIFLKRFTLN
ncbi:sialidase family protein [uncultured Brachyspira sp.]|uniref:sialidase family protein n=1 Tax=uncultured Brachyspira sp. TaxID=221953 RepID=UPI002616DAD6|nr:sialidase family protein [uncultured Brachyspira sp.]